MGAMLPVHVVDIDQFQVRFMYQRGGLDRSARSFVPHEVSGNPAKLGVNAGCQLFQRVLVAVRPGPQELCRFRAPRVPHHSRQLGKL